MGTDVDKTDREQTRRDAERWKELTLLDSSYHAKVVGEQAETILALLAKLEQAERELREALAKIKHLEG